MIVMKMEKRKTKVGGKMSHFFPLKDSARVCFTDYWHFIRSFLLDLLFFFLFAFTYSFFSIRIMGHLMEVSSLMSGLGGSVTAVGQGMQGMNETAMSELISKQQILTDNFKSIVLLGIGAMVSLYILWVIVQGVNWNLAARKVSKEMKKVKLLSYIGQFSLINLFWAVLALVIAYGSVQLSIYNDFAKISIVSQNTINILTGLFFAAWLYFIAVSYALVGKMRVREVIKKTFVLGIRKILVFLPAIVFVLLICVLIVYIISLLQLGFVTTVLLDLLLMLPAVSFGRVLLLTCCENLLPSDRKR